MACFLVASNRSFANLIAEFSSPDIIFHGREFKVELGEGRDISKFVAWIS